MKALANLIAFFSVVTSVHAVAACPDETSRNGMVCIARLALTESQRLVEVQLKTSLTALQTEPGTKGTVAPDVLIHSQATWSAYAQDRCQIQALVNVGANTWYEFQQLVCLEQQTRERLIYLQGVEHGLQ